MSEGPFMTTHEQPASNVNMNDIREKRKRTSKKVSQWYVSGQLTSRNREN